MLARWRKLIVAIMMVGTATGALNIAHAEGQADGHIIVFKKHVDVDREAGELNRRHGIRATMTYRHALRGAFVKENLPPQAIHALMKNPNIAYIEKNGMVKKIGQTTPTGLDRADVEQAIAIDGLDDQIDIDIAILDTGIDSTHPDLRINTSMSVAVIHVTKGPPRERGVFYSHSSVDWDDRDGHGTHVSGTVAAIDNGIGAVGVAPGARVSAVKVLNDDGSGSYAQVIAGIDYVAANADVFSVANMSLGGPTSQALNDAVANTVKAGVVMVVAAGNESQDASLSSPASEPSAITVSALADSDGQSGGLGPDTSSWGPDDTLATFSNFGALVDIAAPGVDIYSTYKDGGYASASGTSMASPMVAGAVALYISMNGRDLNFDGNVDRHDVALVDSALKSSGWSSTDAEYFSGDTDGYAEPLLNVAALVGGVIDQRPVVSITNPLANSVVSGMINIEASASDDSAVLQVEFFVNGTSIGVDNITSDGFSISWDSTLVADGNHNISAVAIDDNSQTSSINEVTVSIDNVDSAPIADAGVDQTIQDIDGNGLETVNLDSTSSSDDIGITSYEWYESGVLIASGATPSVVLSLGVHTITLVVTDSIGQQSQDDVVITVEEMPETGTIATIQSINFNAYGGKTNDKHFEVLTSVVDNLGTPLAGAQVTSDLYKDGVKVSSRTVTTDSTGSALLFDAKNAARGCYQVVITNVSSNDFSWDGNTPANQYCK